MLQAINRIGIEYIASRDSFTCNVLLASFRFANAVLFSLQNMFFYPKKIGMMDGNFVVFIFQSNSRDQKRTFSKIV